MTSGVNQILNFYNPLLDLGCLSIPPVYRFFGVLYLRRQILLEPPKHHAVARRWLMEWMQLNPC